MKTAKYNRSEILSYYDLTEAEQCENIDHEQSNFVRCPIDGSPLSLDMFFRLDSKIWHGIYGQSYFSAYFIRLSKCGTAAVVAYRYC